MLIEVYMMVLKGLRDQTFIVMFCDVYLPQDDEEPEGSQFQPDGGYIPRILFLNSDGVVQPDLINTLGNPQYKFFYSNALMGMYS